MLDGQKQHDMRGLPNTSTHDQQRDSNTSHLNNFSDLTGIGYHSATTKKIFGWET